MPCLLSVLSNGDALETHFGHIGDALGTHWKRIVNALGTNWGRIEDVLGTYWERIVFQICVSWLWPAWDFVLEQ